MPHHLARTRIRVATAVICLLAGLCVASGLVWAQQQANFTADVELVLLHVAVVDPRGGEVPMLSVDDFTVYEDGVKQQIELFVTPSDAPIDVALVMDSSGSMKPVELVARRAAMTFLGRIGVDDCVYVLPFSDQPGPGRWGRAQDPEVRGFINSIAASGGTALYDAVLEGLGQLERANANEQLAVAEEASGEESDGEGIPEEGGAPPSETLPPPREEVVARGPGEAPIILPPRRTDLLGEVDNAIRQLELDVPKPVTGCGDPLPEGEVTTAANARRKALVVLSDGADLDSDASFYEALGAARAASVPVFPVALGYANDDEGLKDQLDELARATGGRLIESPRNGQIGVSYDEVVTLLRTYYLVGYRPQGTGEGAPMGDGVSRWHDVRVDLRRPNFEPLVRPGYSR